MRKSVTLGIVGISCLIVLLSTNRIALGQAGSTGGTIGKSDKSASGGEEVTPSRQRAHLRTNVSPSQGTSRASIGGKWIWNAICAESNQNWNGTFDFDQRSDGTIGGSCSGTPSACHSVSGHVVANKLTLTIGWDYSTGTLDLTIADGNRSMTGSENSRWHRHCTYSGRRF